MMEINTDIRMDQLPIFDPIEAPELDSWFPANKEAQLLVVSLEACKDLSKHIDGLNPKSQLEDLRGLTLMATPLISLLDNMSILEKRLPEKQRFGWPDKDQNAFKESSDFLNQARVGELRKIRNKRSAHHDSNALLKSKEVPMATADLVLPILAHCIRSIFLFLNHNNVYSWTRSDPNKPLESITIFGEVATTFGVDKERRITDIQNISIVKDPRHKAKSIVESLMMKYNHLVRSQG